MHLNSDAHTFNNIFIDIIIMAQCITICVGNYLDTYFSSCLDKLLLDIYTHIIHILIVKPIY